MGKAVELLLERAWGGRSNIFAMSFAIFLGAIFERKGCWVLVWEPFCCSSR